MTRVRAPELTGDVWLNTGGKRITLAGLRGKIVLLDFWTSGCINCVHVIDELRELEHEFADVLVTIGVHSPKFQHEWEPRAVEAAIARYGVEHPVLSDSRMTTWQQYAVKAWPTLVVVDPEGYVVHVAAGEGHASALRRIIGELASSHAERGTLRRGSAQADAYVEPEHTEATLRFPGHVVATRAGRLLVADTAHHSIAELTEDGETLVRRFGSGGRGRTDGGFDVAQFAEPSGLALLPTKIAEQVGYHLVVADTGNHLLRGIDLRNGMVTTVAGTGEQWREGSDHGVALAVDLTSPWDLAWWPGVNGLVVAMAGNHTLTVFDPVDGTVRRLAGTTTEGLRDGPADQAFFAQTSGLAATRERLWLVDAETSSLRWLEATGKGQDGKGRQGGYTVHTAVGTDLFQFGYRDGPAAEAMLQHPLGVAALPDGRVAIADTYNGAVRAYDPETSEVTTLAKDLAEPTGLVVTDAGLVVAESAAHRLRAIDTGHAEAITGAALTVRRPPTILAPGKLELSIEFAPPPGEKLDERYGPATRLEVSAAPPELLTGGAGSDSGLTRTVTLSDTVSEGVLQVVAQAASCDTETEHPVCRVTRQDWGVPIRLDAAGSTNLRLVMAGSPEDTH